MILVDTNVISEIMRGAPSDAVVSWLNGQRSGALYVSTITIGEIEFGLRILPVGSRRAQLKERFERFVSLAFTQRILAFDEAAARSYGEIMGLRREIGRPLSVPDGQIAAIVRANGLRLATCNTRDFTEPIAKLPAKVEPKPGAGQKVPLLAPFSIPEVICH